MLIPMIAGLKSQGCLHHANGIVKLIVINDIDKREHLIALGKSRVECDRLSECAAHFRSCFLIKSRTSSAFSKS